MKEVGAHSEAPRGSLLKMPFYCRARAPSASPSQHQAVGDILPPLPCPIRAHPNTRLLVLSQATAGRAFSLGDTCPISEFPHDGETRQEAEPCEILACLLVGTRLQPTLSANCTHQFYFFQIFTLLKTVMASLSHITQQRKTLDAAPAGGGEVKVPAQT